jgi:CheY-like chemotaxis protein
MPVYLEEAGGVTMNPPHQKPTVLIVDDDPSIRTMLVEVLSLEGFPTETATNGREALQRLAASAGKRVVLLDLLMPVMDGKAMLEALQATPDERTRLKIILVSALNNLETHRDLVVDGQLAKPFTVDQLLNSVESVAAAL